MMTTTTTIRKNASQRGELSLIGKEDMMPGMMGNPAENGTSLIARAEALNAFMKMQPAANHAREASAPTRPLSPLPQDDDTTTCLCFGSMQPKTRRAPSHQLSNQVRPKREYYPDNLSVQPARHRWTESMEWLILSCVDFLEHHGLDERNLFAVSAVDDLVRNMRVSLGVSLPPSTDPHVAAGVIKAQIRHADEPLVAKDCLRAYIDAQVDGKKRAPGEADAAPGMTASAPTYKESQLAITVDAMKDISGVKRAFVLARIMRLLGRVSANVEVSKMNAHCLAKCVAPSMLHWDPNSNFALLMLGKITAFVMTMIEDAKVFDEQLCQKIDELNRGSQ